jgi:16S rRNA (uracil1498-N3)-methyltransferase
MDSIKNLRFPRFFVPGGLEAGGQAFIAGDDANHIASVLRMRAGERVVLCGDDGFEYPAEIISAGKSRVELTVLAKRENDSEPGIYVRLFQCVPKGDKLDFVVQKATELGVSEIIPVISKRCVSKPDRKSNKTARLQKIAEQAAKQSGRGIIPLVHEFTSFNDAIRLHNNENLGIIFYENGGEKLNDIMKEYANTGSGGFKVDVFIGSEGGFEAGEVEAAVKAGCVPASLGKRILRTETAPVAAIAILMNLTGNI